MSISATANGTFARKGSANIFTATNTFTGSVAHQGTTVGFYNVTPATRPTAYTQTYATASKTHAAPTATKPASTAATQLTPYGYSQAQADAIVTAVRALVDDVETVKQVVNQVLDDLQSVGLLQ